MLVSLSLLLFFAIMPFLNGGDHSTSCKAEKFPSKLRTREELKGSKFVTRTFQKSRLAGLKSSSVRAALLSAFCCNQKVVCYCCVCNTGVNPGFFFHSIRGTGEDEHHDGERHSLSVEVLPAVLCAAEAVDLLVLNGELVVVGDLLPGGDRLLRVDDDLLLLVHGDHLGVAVGLRGSKDKNAFP